MIQNDKTSYQSDSNPFLSDLLGPSPIRRLDVICLRGFLALGLSTSILPAMATTRWEIQGGPSYMDRNSTPAVFVESVFSAQRIGSSRLSWSPDVSLGWIGGREIQRFRYSRYTTKDSIGLLAGGIRVHYGSTDDWYQPLFISFQPALHGGRTQALSSAYEFVSSIGWQGRHFTLQIRHISNGALHKPNRGETMALVGFAIDL